MSKLAEPLAVVAAPYQIVNNRPIVMNAFGLPRAQPLFSRREYALNSLRGYPEIVLPCETCNCWPGPHIPHHWFDGSSGWVTNYFTNVRAYDYDLREPGVFQCNVPHADGRPCGYVIENDACCRDNCCFAAGRNAPTLMRMHLETVHGFRAPPKRDWASGLCDTAGCCDVIFCSPCNGSRIMMALLGRPNEFNVWWCLYFFLAGCQRSEREGGGGGNSQSVYWVPPHLLIAVLTRTQIVHLANIDENCCWTAINAVCCPICSVAQTYRELSANGVWPGGICNAEPPAVALAPLKVMP